MPKNRRRHRLDVLDIDLGPAIERGASAGAHDQRLSPARADTPENPVADELWRGAFRMPRRANQSRYVIDTKVAYRNAADDMLKLEQFVGPKHRFDGVAHVAGGDAIDRPLIRFIRVIDVNLEQEAVELCFGKRIRSLLLDRILCRQHEKRIGKLVTLSTRAHLSLLHPFEKRGLSLRRRP